MVLISYYFIIVLLISIGKYRSWRDVSLMKSLCSPWRILRFSSQHLLQDEWMLTTTSNSSSCESIAFFSPLRTLPHVCAYTHIATQTHITSKSKKKKKSILTLCYLDLKFETGSKFDRLVSVSLLDQTHTCWMDSLYVMLAFCSVLCGSVPFHATFWGFFFFLILLFQQFLVAFPPISSLLWSQPLSCSLSLSSSYLCGY